LPLSFEDSLVVRGDPSRPQIVQTIGDAAQPSLQSILRHAGKAALTPGGALVTGDGVTINVTDSIANIGGVIDGGNGRTVLVAGQDIVNRGGSIAGASVALRAGRDIRNESLVVKDSWATQQNSGSTTALSNTASIVTTGALNIDAGRDLTDLAGKLSAGSAVITAGNDIRFYTVKTGSTYDSLISGYTESNSSVVHQLSQISTSGDLTVIAGTNLNLTGTQVSIGTGGNGTGRIVAGGNVSISAAVNETKTSQYNDPSSKAYDKRIHDKQMVVGAGVVSSGDLLISAGANSTGNLNVEGSAIVSESKLLLEASNDINITSKVGRHVSDTATRRETSGFLKSSSSTAANFSDSTRAIGSTVSGGAVAINSGRDTLVSGSVVVADKDIGISAGRDLSVVSAQNSTSEQSSSSSKKSGLVGGASIGKVKSAQDSTLEQVTQVSSQIASLGGNVSLSAGNQYTQTSSQVVAPEGDIDIRGKDVLINAASDTSHGTEHSKYSKTAIGVTVSIPLLENIQAISAMKNASENAGDGRMKALATLNGAFNAIDAASKIKGLPESGKPGVNVGVSLGSSKSESNVERNAQSAVASTVSAGRNVSVVATGGGVDSDLTAIGSNINAGKQLILAADNDVNLIAAQSTASQHSDNKAGGANIGVGFVVGGQQDGFAINVGLHKASGRADGDDLTYTNTHVTGGGSVSVISGNDTTLKGAVIESAFVQANIGGDLNVESLQDRSTYESKQKSAGLSASVCIPPFCTGTSSVSANVNKLNATGDYLSVIEQSGIKAGDSGFQINAGGNTNLKGGVISSRDAAISAGKNLLNTATLTTSDLINKSEAEAKSIGFGLSSSMLEGKYQTGKTLLGNSVNSAGLDSSSSGQTRSAVSNGQVLITDHEKQFQLTDKAAVQEIAALNRDTINANKSSEKYDAAAMLFEVDTIRSNREAIFNEATKFADESYRTMFIAEAEIYVLIKDENNKVVLGDDERPLRRKLTDEEKQYLKPSSDGKVHVANNGIFNDEKAAARYANQHSTSDGEQYFIHMPEANSVISELTIAGYQKFLEGEKTALTNATQEVKSIMYQYGKDGLHLDGHSRGSMTVGNAMESILASSERDKQLLSNTTITFFGPAYNAQKADSILNKLQGRDFKDEAAAGDYVLALHSHYLDPVSSVNGKNPSTGGSMPEGSSVFIEKLKVMFGNYTAHNCYGAAVEECRMYWDGQISLPVKKNNLGNNDE
jgi:filamentous hemagglutinin